MAGERAATRCGGSPGRWRGSNVDLLLAPALTDVAGPRLTVRPVEAVPLLEVDEPVFDGPRRLVKGVFDRVVGSRRAAGGGADGRSSPRRCG